MFNLTFNNALRFGPKVTSTVARQTSSVEKILMIAIAVAFAFASMQSQAGAGGTEFTQVYDQITGWANGTLGKTMAVSALLVGLGLGVIKQSIISAVVGVAMALVSGFGPGVIDGVISSGVTIVAPI
jgi:conjugal transfer pilus assembly protein TraA